MKAGRLLTLLALAPLAMQAQAASVRCHIVYGGEHFTVDAAPTDDPYRATGTKVGRYFEFKPVYVDRVATGKAVKVYVYGMATGQPVLIHAATHAPPFAGKQEGRGFTGLHAVYEPTKSSELQYWCEHLP